MFNFIKESNYSVVSAGLAIDGAWSPDVKWDNAFTYVLNQRIYDSASGSLDLTGVDTLLDGYHYIITLFIDASGTVTAQNGVPLLSTVPLDLNNNIKDPILGQSVFGYLIVEANGAIFVPGTTPLDDSNVVVTYYDVNLLNSTSSNVTNTLFAGQLTTVGWAATEAFTIPGILSTDWAFVQMVNLGSTLAGVPALIADCTANTLSVNFGSDPGNDAVINYQILRAV